MKNKSIIKLKGMLGVVILLCLVIAGISGPSFFSSAEGVSSVDVSKNVVMGDFEINYQKAEGTSQSMDEATLSSLTLDGLAEGEIISLSSTWSVSTEKLEEVKGNYFLMPLPNQTIFEGGKGPFPVKLGDKEIGSFTIENGDKDYKKNLKVLINADITETSLDNGKITVSLLKGASGVETKGESSSSSVASGTVNHTPHTGPHGGNGGTGNEDTEGVHNFVPETNLVPIYKTVKQNDNHPENLIFTFYVNRDEMKDFFEKKDLNVKENLYIIDELPEGLEYKSFAFDIPIYAPAVVQDGADIGKATKELSQNAVITTNLYDKQGKKQIMLGSKVLFKIEEKTSSETTWDDFKNSIINGTDRKVGIFDKKKVVIKLGNFPNEELTYHEADTSMMKQINKLPNEIHNRKKVSNDQLTIMKEAYSKTDATKADREISSFNITITTTIKDKTKPGFSNEVFMYWGGNQSSSSKAVHGEAVVETTPKNPDPGTTGGSETQPDPGTTGGETQQDPGTTGGETQPDPGTTGGENQPDPGTTGSSENPTKPAGSSTPSPNPDTTITPPSETPISGGTGPTVIPEVLEDEKKEEEPKGQAQDDEVEEAPEERPGSFVTDNYYIPPFVAVITPSDDESFSTEDFSFSDSTESSVETPIILLPDMIAKGSLPEIIMDEPVISDEELDIEIDNDFIPEGSTHIEKRLTKSNKTTEDIELGDEGLPRGKTSVEKNRNKKYLALTGGLRVLFIPAVVTLVALIAGYVILELKRRKNNKV